MAWGGQGIFALPCGSSGGAEAEAFGVTLDSDPTTTSDGVFEQIGNLVLNVPVSEARAAVISLTGTGSNLTGDHRTEFKVSVDGSELDDVCLILASTGEDPETVAVTGHAVLSPGTRVVRAVWRTQTGGTGSALINQLHLEVILAQAVP